MEENLLDISAVAKLLNVKESWLRMAIFKREIPFIKIGRLIRFKKEDIEDFIKSNSN